MLNELTLNWVNTELNETELMKKGLKIQSGF